jgi:hypothetical protein
VLELEDALGGLLALTWGVVFGVETGVGEEVLVLVEEEEEDWGLALQRFALDDDARFLFAMAPWP